MYGKDMHRRAKELEGLRKEAYEYLDKHPTANATELVNLLHVKKGTAQTWITKFRISRGMPTDTRRKKKTVPEQTETPLVSESAAEEGIASDERVTEERIVTWQEIVKSVPNIETLGMVLLHGVTEEMKSRDESISALTADNLRLQEENSNLKHALDEETRLKNRIIKEHNEQVAKHKIGHLTLDQAAHRLVRREI